MPLTDSAPTPLAVACGTEALALATREGGSELALRVRQRISTIRRGLSFPGKTDRDAVRMAAGLALELEVHLPALEGAEAAPPPTEEEINAAAAGPLLGRFVAEQGGPAVSWLLASVGVVTERAKQGLEDLRRRFGVAKGHLRGESPDLPIYMAITVKLLRVRVELTERLRLLDAAAEAIPTASALEAGGGTDEVRVGTLEASQLNHASAEAKDPELAAHLAKWVQLPAGKEVGPAPGRQGSGSSSRPARTCCPRIRTGKNGHFSSPCLEGGAVRAPATFKRPSLADRIYQKILERRPL